MFRGEGDSVLDEMCVRDAIRHMETKNRISIEAGEAGWYGSRLSTDRFQHGLMTMYYSRWMQGGDVLRGATRMDYYTLYAHLLRHMAKHGLVSLARAMCSRHMREGERKVSRPVRAAVQKIAREVASKKIWAEIKGKYVHAAEKLDHAAPVERICMDAYAIRRMEIPMWRERNERGEEPFSCEPAHLAMDAARFARMCD